MKRLKIESFDGNKQASGSPGKSQADRVTDACLWATIAFGALTVLAVLFTLL